MSMLDRVKTKYGARLAALVVATSAYVARRCLKSRPPMRILVDNTVLAHAVTHETAWISTGTTMWGEQEIETGYSARIPVRRNDESREYLSIQYLAGIAHLARQGYLELMTSGELGLEQWWQPIGRFKGYGLFDHSLFSGIKFRSVDGSPEVVLGPKSMGFPSLQDQMHQRLSTSNDPIYSGLLNQLGPGNNQDAWHIRTAEAHGMDCFLTMDFKLCKILHGRRKQEPVRSLRVKVCTPEQLGKQLGLIPVNPSLLSYDDASFPVRPDLNWPNGRRNPPKRADSE